MASTKIKITYQDRDYVLEYTRDSARRVENAGFSAEKLSDERLTMIPLLWHGAFLEHHPKVKDKIVNEIWDKFLNNKEKLVETLLRMFNDARDTLFDEPDEDDEKNVTWEAES